MGVLVFSSQACELIGVDHSLTALHASMSVPGLLGHGQSPQCVCEGASVS